MQIVFKPFNQLSKEELTQVKRLTLKGESMMREKLQSYNKEDLPGEMGLAITDNKVLGWVLVEKEDYPSASPIEASITIYTNSQYRNQGIASKLFLSALEHSKGKYKQFAAYPHDLKSSRFFTQEKIIEFVKNNKLKLSLLSSYSSEIIIIAQS